jgi:hypothetical protein
MAMVLFNWGVGGTQRSTFTASPGDGWTTAGIPAPNVRTIYDGTKPIRIISVVPTAGSGDRTGYYAIGASGWRTSGYHNISDSSVFTFRVARDSGTIYLALLLGQPDYDTYWYNGALAPSGDNAIQPGQMSYQGAPSAPGTTVTPNNSVPGRVDIGVTAPADNGGATVTNYTHQISTNSAFTNVIAEWESPSSSTSRTGLPTGQTLYHRAMAQNVVTEGVSKKGGAASTTRSFSLGSAPVTAPGLAIVAAASGISAGFTITPPSDTGGLPISGYEIEYEYLSPAPIPTPALQTIETTATTGTASPLVPGASYRWRARAENAVGFSPYSSWQTVVQPKPSTSPGQYFDGSTAATADVTYSWTGTANNSASIATSPGVLGWEATISTDIAVLSRATGGRYGSYSARLTFKKDRATDLNRAGQANANPYRTAVTPLEDYSASIMVYLPRPQRMAAEITWVDSGGVLVTRTAGASILVPANTWVTLNVQGQAPAGSAYGVIRAMDVIGDGWIGWLSGESFVLDAAMFALGGPYPYFDGSFPDVDQFTYAWEGTANNSHSVRTTVETEANPLIDPDCVVVPPAPRPPVVPNTCIDEIGVWRRYWFRVDSGDVREWFDTIPTVTVKTGASAERQVRLRYYANPFERELSDLQPDDFCAEQIISYLPADSVLTLDGISESAWASVQGGASLDAEHLLYGSDGMPPTWPVLECGIGYYITMDVPPENVAGNVSLDFDLVVRY